MTCFTYNGGDRIKLQGEFTADELEAFARSIRQGLKTVSFEKPSNRQILDEAIARCQAARDRDAVELFANKLR